MEVSHTLAEGHQGARQHLDACALCARSVTRQLVGQAVKQGEVVVVLGIVHHLTGLAHVARGLVAIGNVL